MVNVKQEMPPSGGFTAINWMRLIKERKKTFVYFILGGFAGSFILGRPIYSYMYRTYHMRRVEDRGAYIATNPIIMAERDRKYLRELRKNRDYEVELMKDVPNWTVGCLFNEPVYHHLVDTLPRHAASEMYAHTDPKFFKERAYIKSKR